MKKRCTNSTCRKEFRLMPGKGRCPYCGKQYPRIQTAAPVRKADSRKNPQGKPISPKISAGEGLGFAVILNGWQGVTRLGLVKTLRALTGSSLRDAVLATKRPTIVARNLSWEKAEGMSLQLEQMGGIMALVPDRNAENYGVPLSGG